MLVCTHLHVVEIKISQATSFFAVENLCVPWYEGNKNGVSAF